jgi:hypothetical protein
VSSRTQLSLSAVVTSGVGDQAPVDDVGDASFQRPDGFFGGLALGEFLLVVVPALTGVAELGDGGGVVDVVEFAVPSRVEPMPPLVP